MKLCCSSKGSDLLNEEKTTFRVLMFNREPHTHTHTHLLAMATPAHEMQAVRALHTPPHDGSVRAQTEQAVKRRRFAWRLLRGSSGRFRFRSPLHLAVAAEARAASLFVVVEMKEGIIYATLLPRPSLYARVGMGDSVKTQE